MQLQTVNSLSQLLIGPLPATPAFAKCTSYFEINHAINIINEIIYRLVMIRYSYDVYNELELACDTILYVIGRVSAV